MQFDGSNLSFNQGRYEVSLFEKLARGQLEDTKHQRTFKLYWIDFQENPTLFFRWQTRVIYIVFQPTCMSFYKTQCTVASNTVVTFSLPEYEQVRERLIEWTRPFGEWIHPSDSQ